jgi:hypothetical protein
MKLSFSTLGSALAASILLTAVPSAAQAPAPAAKPSARTPAKAFVPAKTPWGDPDLQGIYTNKDESGIPFESPGQFAGKTNADVDDEELRELIEARAKAAVERAPGIGGAETGAGPTHWYENYGAKNSRAWLVSDPPDGVIPAATAEANARNAERVRLRSGRGPADSPEDRSLYDRCITRGIPSSMMPAGYGSFYEIVQGKDAVALRYEMIHEHRIVPIDRGERRPHVGEHLQLDLGDARGWYEGSSLVIEKTNSGEFGTYRGASEQPADRALSRRRNKRSRSGR